MVQRPHHIQPYFLFCTCCPKYVFKHGLHKFARDRCKRMCNCLSMLWFNTHCIRPCNLMAGQKVMFAHLKAACLSAVRHLSEPQVTSYLSHKLWPCQTCYRSCFFPHHISILLNQRNCIGYALQPELGSGLNFHNTLWLLPSQQSSMA